MREVLSKLEINIQANQGAMELIHGENEVVRNLYNVNIRRK